MKVIALKGKSNVGKSETVNIVYQFLLSEGFQQMPGIFSVCGNPAMRDFIDVLEKDGVKVGIVSQGDYVRELKKHLHLFKTSECVIAICACTTYKF